MKELDYELRNLIRSALGIEDFLEEENVPEYWKSIIQFKHEESNYVMYITRYYGYGNKLNSSFVIHFTENYVTLTFTPTRGILFYVDKRELDLDDVDKIYSELDMLFGYMRSYRDSNLDLLNKD